MNYLETAKVAAEEFPFKELYTEVPAEVELRWIETLASLALAEETRLMRVATEEHTRAMRNILRVPEIQVKSWDWHHRDNRPNVPWFEIDSFVSKAAEEYVERNWKMREDNLWAMLKRWWRRDDQHGG
jgi:hypothetical protein